MAWMPIYIAVRNLLSMLSMVPPHHLQTTKDKLYIMKKITAFE
jgi:hypothetical protein